MISLGSTNTETVMCDEYEDNTTLQADEIEALSAIYEKDFNIEDAANRIYSIVIKNVKQDKQIIFQVTLPPDYPRDAPPFYQFSAPWMKREDKMLLCAELEDIYCAGESILHQWIEKIREILETRFRDTDPRNDDEHSQTAVVSSGKSEDEVPYIFHGPPLTDRKSTFQAHLAIVVSVEEVKKVLPKLLENSKIASATHNIYAYRILPEASKTAIQDCEDDGETHAGSRLLHLLQILDVVNVIVVVSRWYGGIHLGPARFKHINNVARDILQEHGLLQQKGKLQDAQKSKRTK